MGLDVYVGPLTRYHGGAWETVVQQAGRAAGLQVEIVRPDAGEIAPPDEIRAAVVAWRSQLNAALGLHLPAPLTWDEGDDQPYFTDKPDWDGFGAAVVWAAHLEHPEFPRPARVTVEDWVTDPAYVASQAPEATTRYPALLSNVELWLPGDFAFTFRAPDVLGRPIEIGSVERLAADLEHILRVSWTPDAAALEAWRQAGPQPDGPFEEQARFGLAVLHALATTAAAHRLPIRLDY